MMLAREAGAGLVLMDDNAAKKTAKFLGFNATGTFGVLLRAKREGIIGSVRELVDAIIADGFHASPELRLLVLEMAGGGLKVDGPGVKRICARSPKSSSRMLAL